MLVFDAIERHDVATEFAIEFAEAWGGEFGCGRLGKVPRTFDVVGGVPVKVLFSPNHGPEAEVVKQLLWCPKGGRIDCAMFTFAGSSAVDDDMIVLAGAERSVRVVLDPGQAAMPRWPAARWLKEGGVDVLVPNRRRGFRKLHHKLLVVDSSIVVAGSFNYTAPATLLNDEALLVIGSPHDECEGVEVDHAACVEIAAFFGAEIDRIASDSHAWEPQ